MSATPEVRYVQVAFHADYNPAVIAARLRYLLEQDDFDAEVTVSPLVSPRTTPADETALREFEDHLRSLHRGGWSPDSIPGRNADTEFDSWLSALAASPADADTADGLDPEVAARWASCDRAEAIRQAELFHAEMLRWTGLFEQMRDERDDLRDDAEQVAQAWDEGFRTSDRCWTETSDLSTPDDLRTNPANPYRAASSPVAATSEPVDHFPTSATTMRGTSAVCTWCGELFASEEDYREHERVMVRARRAREAVAATSEGT